MKYIVPFPAFFVNRKCKKDENFACFFRIYETFVDYSCKS